jgi:hypothetical protein
MKTGAAVAAAESMFFYEEQEEILPSDAVGVPHVGGVAARTAHEVARVVFDEHCRRLLYQQLLAGQDS